MPPKLDLPQGTLDLLILRALALEPQHGWAITLRIHALSRETVEVGHGSLYPALHRLERRGLIRAKWRTTENNRRGKYYELTRTGQTALETHVDQWRRLAVTMSHVLGET